MFRFAAPKQCKFRHRLFPLMVSHRFKATPRRKRFYTLPRPATVQPKNRFAELGAFARCEACGLRLKPGGACALQWRTAGMQGEFSVAMLRSVRDLKLCGKLYQVL